MHACMHACMYVITVDTTGMYKALVRTVGCECTLSSSPRV